MIHIESGFKADVYLSGDDPFEEWAFGRRRAALVEGETVQMAPPEYVIVRKLEFFREGSSEKHLRDIRTMIENPASKIDDAELKKFIEERNLAAEWARARKAAF